MDIRVNPIVSRLFSDTTTYRPTLFRLTDPAQLSDLQNLSDSGQVLSIHDHIEGQLTELIKMKFPSRRIAPEEYSDLIRKHLGEQTMERYGVWAYYPWNGRLVHLLDEEEFSMVRTNRNQYKITRSEQKTLSSKRIGIVGLSVGQSIALTLSMERTYGELRLADFDTLELSNLNRIRTGVHNLSLGKAVITAREIAEIDPYLHVRCFRDGLTEANMDDFFSSGGLLDLLVDECDSLDIKILARYKARQLGVPVLMDTSDRGMLDVERFDLEPDRPLLHGTIETVDPLRIKDLSTEEKIPVMLQMLGLENISLRAKASMLEVEQTINTWPQLASSVTLGGAIGADVSRRILLDQFHQSGRYYIDLEELISDPPSQETGKTERIIPFEPLNSGIMKRSVEDLSEHLPADRLQLSREQVSTLVRAAAHAPSTGNDQPWKWLYTNHALYLFHEEYRSHSFGDYKKTASFISLGAAFENLSIIALEMGIVASHRLFPDGGNEHLVASITFRPVSEDDDLDLADLAPAIFTRHTNRNLAPKQELQAGAFRKLQAITETIPEANLRFFTAEKDLRSLAGIIGACDKMRLLHPQGHSDFVNREMRWTSEEALQKRDGIDIRTLGLGHSLQAALKVIRDEEVIRTVKEFGGGNALGMMAMRTVSTASALCMISIPDFSLPGFFNGGRAMQRFWLEATRLGIAVHPVISPLYFFARYLHGGEELSGQDRKELEVLRAQFRAITGASDQDAEVFLAKLSIAPEPELKALRLPLEEILFF